MRYPDPVDVSQGGCLSCSCYSVCFTRCQCQGDILSPTGMINYLCAETPVRFVDVCCYVQQKLITEEEEERKFEESSERSTSSSEDSSSSEVDD